MTRFEELQAKAQKCREAALRTRGFMRYVWLDHATELAANKSNTKGLEKWN